MDGAAAAPAPVTSPTPTPQNGPPQSGGLNRAPDGKFTKAEAPAAAPQNDDPEFDLGDRKMKRSALMSELGRARQASKLLTEAQQRAAKAEQMERAHSERMESLKKDPRAVLQTLKDAGFDAKQIRDHLSSILYSEFIEPEQMSPEALRIRELERTLNEKQQREQAEQEKQRTAAEEKATVEAAAQLEAEFSDALESARVPRTKAAIRRIASVMTKYEARGQSISIEQAADLVRHEMGGEMSELATSASIDDLRDFLGDAAFKAHVKKVLDWGLAQARPGATSAPRPAPRPLMQPTGKPQRLTTQQFDQRLKEVLKKG